MKVARPDLTERCGEIISPIDSTRLSVVRERSLGLGLRCGGRVRSVRGFDCRGQQGWLSEPYLHTQ
ncbi:hypothetical protein [Nostoc sp. C052]|uniref:hypothetical protein n=1 Tax=Nostoc sp. C052 TaxID=2576902 RepID=UPI00211834EE|nr:hypothetical protein [Nostoc sp. C052]